MLQHEHDRAEKSQHSTDQKREAVRRGAHAVLLLDRAGWHTTPALRVPKNITMILLPSRAPERMGSIRLCFT